MTTDKKPPQPSELRRTDERTWRYVPAGETDVRRTWARFGWSPLPNLKGTR